MGLLTETNEQYYAGQQAMVATGTASPNEVMSAWTGDTTLVNTTSTTNANFKVKLNNIVLASTAYSMVNNIVTMNTVTVAGDIVIVELLDDAKWANYGSYEYIKMEDVVNNFLLAYTGEGRRKLRRIFQN